MPYFKLPLKKSTKRNAGCDLLFNLIITTESTSKEVSSPHIWVAADRWKDDWVVVLLHKVIVLKVTYAKHNWSSRLTLFLNRLGLVSSGPGVGSAPAESATPCPGRPEPLAGQPTNHANMNLETSLGSDGLITCRFWAAVPRKPAMVWRKHASAWQPSLVPVALDYWDKGGR